MLAGWCFDCVGLLRGGWGDGLERVDWEGIEEFVGYYEGCFVFAWIYLVKVLDGEGKLT